MAREGNLIVLFDAPGESVLCCLRRRPPYAGLYNLPGGRVEPGESGQNAAARELMEETGVAPQDASLRKMLRSEYFWDDWALEVYVGRLNRPMDVYGEENELRWMPLSENFYDSSRFAGAGNVGHFVEYARRFSGLLPEAEP